MTTNPPRAARNPIARGLLIAGLILVAAVALRLLSPDYLRADLASRSMGALLGMVVVIYANAVPKSLSPWVELRSGARLEQAMRRFSGWTLTLGGMTYAAMWLFAPVELANLLAGASLGLAFLLAIGCYAWGLSRGPRD
jgi:hypothetical protein